MNQQRKTELANLGKSLFQDNIYNTPCLCRCRHDIRWLLRQQRHNIYKDNENSFKNFKDLIKEYQTDLKNSHFINSKRKYLDFSECLCENLSFQNNIKFLYKFLKCKCCKRHQKRKMEILQ